MSSSHLALRAAVAAVLLLAAAASEASDNPWQAFDQLRAHLRSDGPYTVEFRQSFVPAGFSDGEQETGKLFIGLPECLRWDYGDPFAKSFLLCGDTAYYWNPGEPSGHRYPVANEEAPGLDFFLLTTDDLRLRYNATAQRSSEGLRVHLDPIRPTDDVVSLEVLLDTDDGLVRSLGYRDAEGNETTFVLSDYRVAAPAGIFEPPAGVEWEDQ